MTPVDHSCGLVVLQVAVGIVARDQFQLPSYLIVNLRILAVVICTSSHCATPVV